MLFFAARSEDDDSGCWKNQKSGCKLLPNLPSLAEENASEAEKDKAMAHRCKEYFKQCRKLLKDGTYSTDTQLMGNHSGTLRPIAEVQNDCLEKGNPSIVCEGRSQLERYFD